MSGSGELLGVHYALQVGTWRQFPSRGGCSLCVMRHRAHFAHAVSRIAFPSEESCSGKGEKMYLSEEVGKG